MLAKLNQPWIIGLVGISIILGWVVSIISYLILKWITGAPRENLPTPVIITTGQLTGIIERVFFTVAIAAEISGIGGAMAAWIAVKAQSHFNLFTTPQSKQDIPSLYSALLTSLISLIFAVLGGWVWKTQFIF